MNASVHTSGRARERGFTLLESVIVVGLSALLAVGIVAGLLEGLETLHSIADAQSIDYGHQRAMRVFLQDVQAATWFYNGTVHDEESEAEVPRLTASPYVLILGYPGPDGGEVWVRYKVRFGPFSEESYLMRTVLTTDGEGDGTTHLTTGVANLGFSYATKAGESTDQIPEIGRVAMALSINIGGATVQRIYEATMRNPNLGVKEPPGDFDGIETGELTK